MINFEKLMRFVPGVENKTKTLTTEESLAINSRADVRRMEVAMRLNLINLKRPGENNAVWLEALDNIKKEASGESNLESQEQAEAIREYFLEIINNGEESASSILAEYWADIAKAEDGLNIESDKSFSQAKNYIAEAKKQRDNIPPVQPEWFQAEAVMLGARNRQVEKMSLPGIDILAKVATSDMTMLNELALVFNEEDKKKFITELPEEKKESYARIMDATLAPLLHQSLVEEKTGEDKERKVVRMRLFNELKKVVETGAKGDRYIAQVLGEALVSLGGDTYQLLLDIIEDEKGVFDDGEKKKENYLPRVIKVLLDEFSEFRGNDLVMRIMASEGINTHLSIYLMNKLVKNNYLPTDVKKWWDDEKKQGKSNGRSEKERLEIVKRAVADLRIMPSQEILQFMANDNRWQGIGLDERIEKIQSSQAEFDEIKDGKDLVSVLANDDKAMLYYLLNGGKDRFNLINNYDFGKFKEMIGLINQLEIHETPLNKFETSLQTAGMSGVDAKTVIKKLRGGHFFGEQAERIISFEASENALVKNANLEIGRVLGRKELGVVMLYPVYREYLEADGDGGLIDRMKGATTMTDRLTLIDEIETKHPHIRERAKTALAPAWRALGEKMLLEMTLDQVFSEDAVAIRGEELMPRLDSKRFDLKKIKKELLVALKGGNKENDVLSQEFYKKRKARANLSTGLEKQNDEAKKVDLQRKIEAIDLEISEIEKRRAIVNDREVTERFAHMNEGEKKEEMERLSKEIIAISTKSPSAIFTYLTMQVLGEEKLRESDIALVQELESHLQSPFQQITDAVNFQKPRNGTEKKNIRVRLEYLDKKDRLMNMVRFADSKICCFSSSNYEMKVAHDTPNKYWVASINADPLSFVISMEIPQGGVAENGGQSGSQENLGFVFGSFALNDKAQPAIMLNGIYYAPGVENKEQVSVILEGVKDIFRDLPIKTISIAEQHGGSLGKERLPEGFTSERVEMTRLRALDDGQGDVETKIYDDLNTGDALNRPHFYGGNVWHKKQ